jgi:serine/threonine-protein kinase
MQPALASGIDKSRYELLTKIASGGMGTVYVGRLRGAAGFRRLVAVKRAHPHLVEQKSFAKMLLKEAKLASLIQHPNAVSVVDVEELEGELLLVMDYVDGVPLSSLITALDPEEGQPVPPSVAVRIALDVAAGLHACHSARDEDGQELGLVHRDVSPQNVLVGSDGQARLTDFGIAKSLVQDDKLTQTGTMRGKSGYMAPEYAATGALDRRSDVFALGVVLWETLAGERLFRGATELETLRLLTETEAPPVSSRASWIGDGLDHVIAVALDRDPDRRFDTAEAFANALEQAARGLDLVARHREVGDLVRTLFGEMLDERRRAVRLGATLEPGTITSDMVPSGEPETADLEERAAPVELDAKTAEEPSTLEASTLSFTTSRKRKRRWLTGAIIGALAVATAAAVGLRDEVNVEPQPTSIGASAPPERASPRASPTATVVRAATGSAERAEAPTEATPAPAHSSTTAILPLVPAPKTTTRSSAKPKTVPQPGPKPEMSAAPNPFKNGSGATAPKRPY